MPAAPAVIAAWAAVAVTTVATTYQGIEHNQEVQHAKGAAEAQQTSMNAQIDEQKKAMADQEKQSADAAAGAATAASTANDATASAESRKRAMASGTSNAGSTILTSPLGAPAAETFSKTLLGA